MTEIFILVLLKYGSVVVAVVVAAVLTRKKRSVVQVAVILTAGTCTYFVMRDIVLPAAWDNLRQRSTSIRVF